jgi:phage shock protein PspC (stress-responsive transcriptional regulator)
MDMTRMGAEFAGELAPDIYSELFDFRPTSSVPSGQSSKPSDKQLQKLIQYSEDLKIAEVKRKRRHNRWFTASGLAMAAAGTLIMLSTVMPDLISWGVALGIFGAVAGGITALSAFSASPLQKLYDEVKKVRQKVATDLSKREANLPKVRTKNRKLIAGVCSTIADRTGIPVGLVRFLYLLLIPFSSGFLIPLYFVAAVVMGLSNTREETTAL